MSDLRRAIIVGASGGVGRHLSEAMARAGYNLTLVSRDLRDLEPTAADLSLRYGRDCTAFECDIGDPAFDAEAFANYWFNRPESVDCLLIPAGAISPNDFETNPAVVASLTATNYVGPARLAAAVGRLMGLRAKGSIVFFSSIAAAAPRSRNAAYSAAKAALEVYAKALRADLEPRGVSVATIALGYVDTRLSFGMRVLFPIASPQRVGAFVVAHVLHRSGRRHYPRFWWWITTALRHMPWVIYRRLPF